MPSLPPPLTGALSPGDITRQQQALVPPIPLPELDLADLVRPLMGSYDAVFAQAFRFASYSPDTLITQKGYDTLEAMLTLAACRAPFNVKRYAILHKPWSVVASVNDPMSADHGPAQELAAFAQHCLENIEDEGDVAQDFRSVLFETLRALWDGFHVTEIEWKPLDGPQAGKLGFSRFASKPAKQIGFDLDLATLRVRAILPFTPMGGYGPPVPPEKCILYTHNPQHGLPHGVGDGRACYKHWFVLDSLMKFWAIALERFGGPFITASAPQQNMTGAQEALDAIRQGSAAVLPDSVKYEVHQLQPGALEGFKAAADFHAQQIAANILGSTLTTGEGRRVGSLALGQVHENTQEYGLGFARSDLEGVITRQVIRRLIRYNFGERALALCPRLSLGDYDEEDRYQLAQMFDLLIQDGVIYKRAKYIREELGLPALDPEEQACLDQEDAEQKAMQQAELAAKQNSGRSQGASSPGASHAK